LTFYEWLKLEDIYAQLFIVKCRIAMDRAWQRNVGDKIVWYNKLLIGGLVFALLVGVIWFPLLALMQGSPGNDTNPVVAAELKIAFQGAFLRIPKLSHMHILEHNLNNEYFFNYFISVWNVDLRFVVAKHYQLHPHERLQRHSIQAPLDVSRRSKDHAIN
jgi:hypothetical protein